MRVWSSASESIFLPVFCLCSVLCTSAVIRSSGVRFDLLMILFRFFISSCFAQHALKELYTFLNLRVGDIPRQRRSKLGDHRCLLVRYLSVHHLAEGVRENVVYFF